jgi:hypothetical protein
MIELLPAQFDTSSKPAFLTSHFFWNIRGITDKKYGGGPFGDKD